MICGLIRMRKLQLPWVGYPFQYCHLLSLSKNHCFHQLQLGKPLHVDLGTQNKTRPSCAPVKVEVDLLAKLPKIVQIQVIVEASGEVRSKWIKIQYDYMSKYCKQYKFQGHCETDCRVLHPDLVRDVENVEGEINDKKHEKLNNMAQSLKVLASGKVDGYPNSKWTEVRDNRPKRNNDAKGKKTNDKEAAGKEVANVEHQSNVPVQTTNKFVLLEEGEVEEVNQNKKEAVVILENKDKAEENKERSPNPTTTKRTSPRKTGIPNAAKEILSNPNVTGI